MKSSDILISIIMAVYNEPENMLSHAIESMLNQSHKTIEFIIVIDNPKNFEIISCIKKYILIDSRVKMILNSQNIGLALSLNKGIAVSKGSIIARMDADDISEKNRIEKQLHHLLKSDVDIVGTKIRFIDELGRIINRENQIATSNYKISKLLPYGNQMNHPTWMFKKEILNKLEGYRNFPSSQDYDFLLRANYYGYKFSNIDEILLNYRIRDKSISVSKRLQQLTMVLYIQRLYLERVKKGEDSFSEIYINNMKSKKYKLFKLANDMYDKAMVNLKCGKRIRCILLIIGSITLSKKQRRLFFNDLKIKFSLTKVQFATIEVECE